jgi:hypothetical protein
MIEILSASYGADGNDKDLKDVTDKVKKKLSSDRQSISFNVSSSQIGVEDPAPGNPKVLVVKYSINGVETLDRIKDGDSLNAKVPEPAPYTSVGFLAAFYAALWKNLAGATAMFLNVLGASFAYELGRYFGMGIAWVLLHLLFPYAAYWMIPVIVILARAISGTDFVSPAVM